MEKEVKCLECQAEYYLTINNQCERGNIDNCEKLKLNNPNKCDKCKEKHVVIVKSDLDYCFPLPQENFCQEGEITTDNRFGGSLKCTKCIAPNFDLVSTNELPN